MGGLDRNFTPIVVSRQAIANWPGASVIDSDGHLINHYGAREGSCYLIRPDLYIAARWVNIQPQEVLNAMAICLGEGGE